MSKKQQNEKKQNVIQASGLQDAYEYLLRQLCKKGLPTGNVYEFSAQTILSYEKKLKNTNIQVKAQQAAKEAHEKYIKKLQDKEQKNLEEVSRYELVFREEQKRKEIYNQSVSQEPVQRSSIGKSVIEQRNQSVDNDSKSPPKTQKKMPEKQNSPIKQEIKEKKEELDTSLQQQGQIQNQPQAQKDKKQTKKDTKKYDSSILKDLKIEEQKDSQKNQEQVQDQKQNQQQQQQQIQTKVPDQQKDAVKETQKEQAKDQPKQDQPKQDNKKQGKKK